MLVTFARAERLGAGSSRRAAEGGPVDLRRLEQIVSALRPHARLVDPRALHEESREPYRKKGAVSFDGAAAVEALEDALATIRADRELGLFSEESITDALVARLPSCLGSADRVTDRECARLILDDLSAKPVADFHVVRPIMGARLHETARVEFGPCVVSTWDSCSRELAARYAGALSRGLWYRDPEFVVTVHVRARDPERALEIADQQLALFENALRFLIADTHGRFGVGVFVSRPIGTQEHLVLYETGAQSGNQYVGPFDRVALSDPWFHDESTGSRRIWSLLARDPNDWERRLLKAIDWIGKALHDPNPDDAFVQYVFALEALLVFDEKGTSFGPSIVHNIAESTAFVLGRTLEGRIEIEGKIKGLYGIRSAIAHGGHGSSPSRRDLSFALYFSKLMVQDFLVRPEFSTFTSPKHLRDWLRTQRYSVPTSPSSDVEVSPARACGEAGEAGPATALSQESSPPSNEGSPANPEGRTP